MATVMPGTAVCHGPAFSAPVRVLVRSPKGSVAPTAAALPTGLAVRGNTIYVTRAGPIPHVPEEGKVLTFGPRSSVATVIASGAPLLVDVEFGRGRTLFALSQGFWVGPFEGTPAEPDTGTLVRVERDGTLTVISDGLDRPTSMEIIGNTAYVVSLGGEVWTIENIASPPFGRSH